MTPSYAGLSVALGPSWLDPEQLLRMLGPYVLVGLCLIIFAECGLLIGFFMPGDSLLFTAGLFVANGLIGTPIWLVCLLLTGSAVLGNVVGYYLGYRAGPVMFDRSDSRLFKREYVDKTHAFFDKYGARAIVLGRFVPIVRTFITAVAGVGRMDRRKYFTYSILGGVGWATGVTLLGFWLGGITFVRNHVELILIGIVALSFVPILIEALRARALSQRTARSSR
ncbi:MAG TPA: VTT domain-containing protein [Pseudonocardiaceae bacterium]|nr:VTT domain-containing protein [Pseudonocardiaceae bacterium]